MPAWWTTVLAGDGLKTGQAVSRTDATGATVEDGPISARDFWPPSAKPSELITRSLIALRTVRSAWPRRAQPVKALFA